MNATAKRFTVLALALLMLALSVTVPVRRAEAAMTYNNAIGAVISCAINSSGRLTANLSANGYKNLTTRIAVELYVEKRVLGVFWSIVDIGCTDNVWKDSTTSYSYTNVFAHNMPSSGTYRVTVTFTVSGTGGSDDTIVRTETVSY